MRTSTNVRIGLLGASRIAPNALLKPASEIGGVEIAAVGARDKGRAEAFAAAHNIPVVHDSYEALVADESLDAIYNPLVPSSHAEWSIKALEHGKHVLCEKPFARNATEAAEMVRVARLQERVLMEAFHWRYHPLADAMLDVVAKIGPLVRGEAVFTFNLEDKERWLFNLSAGGGSAMDQGCYPIHWMRTLSGEEPEVVRASAVAQPDNVDVSMEADLRFPSGFSAHVRCSMVNPGARIWYLVVEGARGTLRVDNPLAPQEGHRLTAEFEDGTRWEKTYTLRPTYAFQLDAFLEAISGGLQPPTGGDDAVGNMATIDSVYRAAGLPLR
ncbi:MAG TPA: Gfo/Idh/MocA family oxidoreductase [Acidimicrobiales bacterium]|nr:Gfo/Idh/MocA family oxidoreductase [Acidimicrobiales bacterium]